MTTTNGIKVFILGVLFISISPALNAAGVAVPEGFADVFNTRQRTIVEVLYNDDSLGSFEVEYDPQFVYFPTPSAIISKLTSADMPPLTLTKQALLKKLSAPLQRVNKQGFASKDIAVYLDESTSRLQLVFPMAMFKSASNGYSKTYLPLRHQAGFTHSHNINYLSDTWGDNVSISATDVLNLTGNSYIKAAWSYAKGINFISDEIAFYFEQNNSRIKVGRQRLNDNLVSSTPSMIYSFFNSINFDGISLGYMTDNYYDPGNGAASPVTVYLPQAGTVEIYRNGRVIDIQQFSAGLQHLNTQGWPSGGYDVLLVSKLSNGSEERKTVPFFKRSGLFRSGDLEYLFQLGRYDQYRSDLYNFSRHDNCKDCDRNPWEKSIKNNSFAGITLAYTTSKAFSFGGGTILDKNKIYANASVSVPVNLFFAEQLFFDSIYGDHGSTGYQAGLSKNFSHMGFNLSYRSNRFKGDKQDYRRYGVIPKYDFQYWQLGANTLLFWNIGLGVNYSLNSLYQEYGRKNKTEFKTWDVNLNKDFTLSDSLDLRVDLGYHHGSNLYTNRRAEQTQNDNKIYAQFTLGMRERSYNHSQSLYLRSRLSDNSSDNNIYSADYSLNLNNPSFDRGGQYTINSTLNHGPRNNTNGNVALMVDNRFGHNAFGYSQAFSDDHYRQFYLSQRSGFAIGDGNIAWGGLENDSALIIDASDLPANHYFEVQNQSSRPVVVKGGGTSILSMTPYQKIATKAEQVFTGQTDAFYNLRVQELTGWIRPGQVYNVKLNATQNLTVAGRLFLNGKPLVGARVVGGNTVSDEEGLFIGDFTLKTSDRLTSLVARKGDQNYVCPLPAESVKMTQGIMQINEVKCNVLQ